MSNKLQYLAWLAGALAITGLAAFATGRIQRRIEVDSSLVSVDEGNLDLGEVWSQGDFPWNISIKNTSSKRLKVRLVADCSCTHISPNEFELLPRESMSTRLTIDLRSDSSLSPPGGTRKFSTIVKAEIDGVSSHLPSWEFTGSIRDPFSHYTRLISLDSVAGREDQSPSTAFDFRCNEPEMTCDFELMQPIADLQARQDAASPTLLRLECRARQGLSIGSHGTSMLIKPRLADGTELKPIEGWVSVTVHSDIEVIPAVLSLGNLATDDALKSELIIRSRTRQDITVPQLAFDNSNPHCTVRVSGAPQRRTDSEWMLPIAINIGTAGAHVEQIPVIVTTLSTTFTSRITISWVSSTGTRTVVR